MLRLLILSFCGAIAVTSTPLNAQEIYLLTANGRGHAASRLMDPGFHDANRARYTTAAVLDTGGTYTCDAVPDNAGDAVGGELLADGHGPVPFAKGALTDGNATYDWLKPMPYLMWREARQAAVTFTFPQPRVVAVVRVSVSAEEHARRSGISCVRAITVKAGPDNPPQTATPRGTWTEFTVNLRTDTIRIELEGLPAPTHIRLSEVEIWGWPEEPRYATDIVANGGFELASADADAAAAGWDAAKYTPKEEPANLTRSTTHTYRGEHALCMRRGETARIVARNITPTVAGPYTILAWVRSDVKDAGAVQVTGGGHPPPYDQSTHFSVTDNWRQIRYSFMLEPNWGQTSLTQELALIGWPLNGDIYWDDVRLAAGVPPVAAETRAAEADAFWKAPCPTRGAGAVFVERPTHQALGFCWPVEGDYNRNGRVTVSYRRTGAPEWREGLPLMRQMFEWLGKYGWYPAPNMYAGSVMGLEPGIEYEVRFVLTDPDGGTFTQTRRARTRPLPPDSAPGRNLHLYAAGYAGAKTEPAYTDFAAAYAALTPGDTLLVHAGRYGPGPEPNRKPLVEPEEFKYLVQPSEPNDRRAFTLTKPATPTAPILIRAAGDGAAVFDGDEAFELFRLEKADHHIFDGLILQNATTLVAPLTTRGLVIRRCLLRNCRYGVHTGDWESSDFTLVDNVFLGKWPRAAWGGSRRSWIARAAKYGFKTGYEHTRQNVAVQLAGGGHVVAHNRIEGFFDGFAPASGWPPKGNQHPNCAMDIHNNHITFIPDDPIELDAARHNVRCFQNFCAYGMMGISIQPVLGGPVYIYRNLIYWVAARVYKAHNWPSGVCIFNNTSIDNQHFQIGNMWQNTQIMNNTHIATGDGQFALGTGAPTPLTSTLDYNAYGSAREGFLWEFFDHWSRRPLGGGYYPTIADFSAVTGFEKHGLWGMQLADLVQAVAPAADTLLPELDLRLKDGAPVIDRGTFLPTITDGYAGAAPDIGAYELGAAPYHFGPRHPVPQAD